MNESHPSHEDGHEHEWPDTLDANAKCLHCGLAYEDWSETP